VSRFWDSGGKRGRRTGTTFCVRQESAVNQESSLVGRLDVQGMWSARRMDVSPLRGFERFYGARFQGLTPLAITYRSSGPAQNRDIPRAGRLSRHE
jgi:hypothetical protein